MSFIGSIPDFAKGTQLGLVPYFGANSPACSITKVEGHAATFLLTWT